MHASAGTCDAAKIKQPVTLC